MPAGGGGPDGGLRWAAGVLGELRAGGGGAELGRALRRLEDPPGGARAGDFLGALLGPPEPALRAGAGGPPGAHPRGLLGTAPPALQARAVVLLRAAAPLLPRSDLHRALAGLAAPQAVAVSPPARALAAAALGELRGEAPAGAAGGPGDDKLPAGLRGLVQRDRGSLPTLPWAHSARLADLRPAAPAGAGPRGEPPAAEPAARAGLEATPAPPCDALEALERALEGGEGGRGEGGGDWTRPWSRRRRSCSRREGARPGPRQDRCWRPSPTQPGARPTAASASSWSRFSRGAARATRGASSPARSSETCAPRPGPWGEAPSRTRNALAAG